MKNGKAEWVEHPHSWRLDLSRHIYAVVTWDGSGSYKYSVMENKRGGFRSPEAAMAEASVVLRRLLTDALNRIPALKQEG
jgi:hypothetical protein